MSNLTYRLSDPASGWGLLFEATISLVLVGIVGLLIESESVEVTPVSPAAAAAVLVGGAAGFIVHPVFLASERARRLWSRFWVRVAVVGASAGGLSIAMDRGLIGDTITLLAAVGALCGSVAGRAGVYVRARAD